MRPTTLSEAVEARAERPELRPVAGGTDLMVDVNFGRTELAGVLDLIAVAELRASTATTAGSASGPPTRWPTSPIGWPT